MAKRNNGKAQAATAATVGYKGQLWQMADALLGSMNAAEYKHVCLGRTHSQETWQIFQPPSASFSSRAFLAGLVVYPLRGSGWNVLDPREC